MRKQLSCSPLMFLFISLPISVAGCTQLYVGPRSDHFDGDEFFDEHPHAGFADTVKWLLEMETKEWPEWIDDPQMPPPPRTVEGASLRITYVNHATFLIQTGGVNILTDPVWSKTVGPNNWLSVERVRNPGVAMDDLPEIHVVLISHDHYDHLDLPTLFRLNEKFRPIIVSGLGVGAFLEEEGFPGVIELDWWDRFHIPGADVSVEFVPAEHNSGRTPWGRNETLWGGFIIQNAGNIYFAGDSGYGSFVKELSRRFAPVRAAILPLGSYEKRWFMKGDHMNPEEAVRVHRELGSGISVGMHYGTFLEHPEQEVDAHERDLNEAMSRIGLEASEFLILGFGQGVSIR